MLSIFLINVLLHSAQHEIQPHFILLSTNKRLKKYGKNDIQKLVFHNENYKFLVLIVFPFMYIVINNISRIKIKELKGSIYIRTSDTVIKISYYIFFKIVKLNRIKNSINSNSIKMIYSVMYC